MDKNVDETSTDEFPLTMSWGEIRQHQEAGTNTSQHEGEKWKLPDDFPSNSHESRVENGRRRQKKR